MTPSPTIAEAAAEGRMMVARPIIFSAPMVRALLDGRKTMTRRLAWGKKCPRCNGTSNVIDPARHPTHPTACPRCRGTCFVTTLWQRVKPGDRMWARETWQLHSCATDKATIVYAASINGSWTEAHNQFPVNLANGLRAPRPFQEGWRSPIHMPRWASRLTLIVTATKIERLQEISEADATAEGAEGLYGEAFDPKNAPTNRRRFELLWRELHGDGSWRANPEVVVALTFTVHKTNIDAIPKQVAA